ncbi:MAG TPA: ATP synthase F1 subunit gamma [Planctomycetaceae bacterium]|nr:ATP synthase F1 subunit gamma [Planctomycetaceae bacterium]
MAKARAIVKRLKAIRNIRKITRTMELIATARFKKAMDRATEAAAYTRKMSELVADLSQSALDFSHPLLEAHPTEKNAVLLVLTSNRGLCGGYNSGVLKMATTRIAEARAQGQNLEIEVSGKRGISFLRFSAISAAKTYTHFEDKPGFHEVEVLANRFIEAYTKHEIDRLDVAYMRFESSSRQTPVLETLLPVSQLQVATRSQATEQAAHGEAQAVQYEFLPSAREILEEIVPASFKARLFKCFLDAAVSEQIFRMVAMKGATENAGEMISDLSTIYNRARQAQITSELSEIIGGAAALE